MRTELAERKDRHEEGSADGDKVAEFSSADWGFGEKAGSAIRASPGQHVIICTDPAAPRQRAGQCGSNHVDTSSPGRVEVAAIEASSKGFDNKFEHRIPVFGYRTAVGRGPGDR